MSSDGVVTRGAVQARDDVVGLEPGLRGWHAGDDPGDEQAGRDLELLGDANLRHAHAKERRLADMDILGGAARLDRPGERGRC